MSILELLLKLNKVESGDFNHLNKFDFKGVYIICDGRKVVYIGSAYARTIETRLNQYIHEGDTGNTLGKAVSKQLANSEKYDDAAKEKISEAIKKIQKFKVYAIPNNDLEYKLIELVKPLYNNYGKNEY